METGSRNCTYLSNRAQNDLISAMADITLKKVVEDIKDAGSFTVIMDETTDVSGKEQVAIFVDSEEIVHERLIGFQMLMQRLVVV